MSKGPEVPPDMEVTCPIRTTPAPLGDAPKHRMWTGEIDLSTQRLASSACGMRPSTFRTGVTTARGF
jgi:hypothetical protein